MGTTTDPGDPRLGHGSDSEPIPQHDVYLVLSDAERRRGFTRPLRLSYMHVGIAGPRYPLRDLTSEERQSYDGTRYVKYEEYPEDRRPSLGKFWTQEQLDSIGKGCGTVTTMGLAIAETYARSHSFYGSTYCCGCRMHKPVGAAGEFVWMNPDGTRSDERVGT